MPRGHQAAETAGAWRSEPNLPGATQGMQVTRRPA